MSTAKVLIAEDDPDLSDLLELTLERENLEVVMVADGSEVVANCKLHDPDLLLLDLNLPGADGVEVTRQVRADPALSAMPILVVSGLGREDGVDTALAAGANDFLPKPFRPTDLVLRVNLLLSQVRE